MILGIELTFNISENALILPLYPLFLSLECGVACCLLCWLCCVVFCVMFMLFVFCFLFGLAWLGFSPRQTLRVKRCSYYPKTGSGSDTLHNSPPKQAPIKLIKSTTPMIHLDTFTPNADAQDAAIINACHIIIHNRQYQ